ncbi:MAG TPA: hypothetical protein VHB98_21920, partial [Chloroflexota bacterium]|nr:hypothetical protein [Chloroflexota bacterium]
SQARVPIGGEPDVIWLNTRRQRLYLAMGHPGLLQVLDTQTMVIDDEIATEEGAHTFAFDEGRQRLYVFRPRTNRAAVYEEV